MALQVGELFAKLSLDSSSYEMSLDKAKSKLNDVTTGLKVFGAAAVAGMGLGIKAGIEFDTQIQNNTVAFTTMLKDANQAKDLMQQLKDFAASTPYEFPEIANAGKALLAFGFSAKEIQPNLTMLGDIASGIGMNVGELAEIYGKARVQGRLFGEDINQLTGRGIPITKALADTMGVAQSQIKEMVSEGKIGYPELEKAMQSLTEEGGQFAGMMEEQSKTFSGQWSTFKDTLNEALGDAIKPAFNWMTEEGFPKAIEAVSGFNDAMSWLKENMNTLIPIASGLLAGIVAYQVTTTIAAAVTVFRNSLFATTLATKGLTAAMATNPFGLAAIAIGLLVTAGVALYKNWDTIKVKLDELREWFDTKIEEIKTKVTGAWEKIPEQMKEIGINIMKGIANGMFGGLPSLLENAANIGGKLIDKFKEKFKIQSPSVIMEEIGVFITEGLGNGIAKAEEKAMTPLQKTTDKLLESVQKFVKDVAESSNALDVQSAAILRSVEALMKENEQTQLSTQYIKDKVLAIKESVAALEQQNAVMQRNAELTAKIDANMSAGAYTGKNSMKSQNDNYYAANKAVIDKIAKEKGVDIGVASSMLRSDTKNNSNEYGSKSVQQNITINVKSPVEVVKEIDAASKAIVAKP